MVDRRTLLQGVAFIVIVILAMSVVWYVYRSPTGIYARKHADLNVVSEEPASAYTSLDGTPITLNSTDAPITIVNVWASWSPFSAQDFATLDAVERRYGDMVFIQALNRKESKETARAYLDTIGAPTTITYVIDGSDAFFAHFDGYAMPETIVFDAIGNAVFHKRGVLDQDELFEVLESLKAGLE